MKGHNLLESHNDVIKQLHFLRDFQMYNLIIISGSTGGCRPLGGIK